MSLTTLRMRLIQLPFLKLTKKKMYAKVLVIVVVSGGQEMVDGVLFIIFW